MANSETVSVGIVAQIAGFKAGMAEAAKATGEFATGVKEHIERLNGPFEHFNGLLAGIGAIAAGAGFKEIIDDTVKTATETNKLAMAFGTGLAAATDLSVELKTLGIGTDGYTQAAMKLDRQVRANGESLERHGMVIKDSNGRLLDQQTLMQNAVTWLASFKEGTDRNIAAQVAFGRGVGDVNQLMRLTAETAARAKKDVADLGLGITTEDVKNALDYKVAIGELSLTFEGIKKAIGDAVLPYLTKFAQWFREQGPTIISGMKDTVKRVVEFIFDLMQGLGNFGISLIEMLESVGAGLDKLKTRASAAGAGAIIGGGLGLAAGGIGAIPGAAIGGFLGWLAGGIDEGNEKVGKGVAKFDEMRRHFAEGIAAFKETLLSGGESGDTDKPVGVTGSRSAAGMGKGDDAKADEVAKLRAERTKMMNDFELQQEEQLNQEKLDLGQITNQQFLENKLAIQERLNEIDQDALTKTRNIYGQGTVEWEKAENSRVKASEKAQAEIGKINHEIEMNQVKTIEGGLKAVQSAWDSQLAGLLNHTTSWAQAMGNIARTLFMDMIKMAEDWGVKHLAVMLKDALFGKAAATDEVVTHATKEGAKTAATVTGVGTRAAAEQGGLLANIATYTADAMAFIGAQVAKVFAAMTAFLTPVFGPAAPAVALGLAAGVSALALSQIPKLDVGAWDIPRQGVAMLHPEEMVLPAGAASAFRSMATGDMSGAGGDTNNVTVNFSHHGSGELTHAEIQKHAWTIAKAVTEQIRRNPSLS